MTRPAVPPGLAKARAERKADIKARKSGGPLGRALTETMYLPTPATEIREEKVQAWSGKNDGTPGCLRTRETIRTVMYVVPRPAGACGSTARTS